MELGFPYPRRIELLDQLTKTSSARTHSIRFLGSLKSFPIHGVPIELPKYRLNNGRTLAAQAEYLALHPEMPKDFFTRDLERLDVQGIQHGLLKDMLADKGLLDYFRTHEQEDPLVLSHHGFVINGNRRLCAMRELLAEDEHAYGKFKHVSIIVLPPADERDIDALEAQLQIHKDIRADYSWTAEAFMLKTRKNSYQYNEKQLADLYEMTEPEISERLQMLDFADEYLRSRGKPGQYHWVEATKYAFQQLRKFRAKFKSEGPKVVLDQIAYCLLDDPSGGRLYELIPAAAKHLDRIVDSIRQEFPDKVTQPEPQEDEFLGVLDEPAVDILSVLEDESVRDRVRSLVVDVVQAEIAKEREKKRNDYVLLQVRKANSALLDALNGIAETTSKVGVDSQLTEIDRSITRLRDWLKS